MKNHRNVAIELTPLLDVILIMLFLIMTGSQSAIDETKEKSEKAVKVAEAEAGELREKIDVLEEDNQLLSTKVAGLEAFSEYAKIVGLSISYDDNGRHILIDDAGSWDYIDFDNESTAYGERTLRDKLQKLSEREEPIFIVFTYSDEKILTADYNMITSVLSDLKDDDLYIQTKKF